MVFFICGLPGGVDYAMLSAVRYGFMDELTEKYINTHLNTWIRIPGECTNRQQRRQKKRYGTEFIKWLLYADYLVFFAPILFKPRK